MAKVAVVLNYSLDDEYDVTHNSILYAIEETKVNVNSNVTTHPIITGEVIADYMYRMPISYSISGSYSRNGDCWYDEELPNPTVAQFQELFEKVNRQGVVCSITKGIYNGHSVNSASFTKRRNMVLSSISWTEGTNSVDFDFTFTEVLRAEAGDIVPIAASLLDDGFLTPVSDVPYGSLSEINSQQSDADVLVSWIFRVMKGYGAIDTLPIVNKDIIELYNQSNQGYYLTDVAKDDEKLCYYAMFVDITKVAEVFKNEIDKAMGALIAAGIGAGALPGLLASAPMKRMHKLVTSLRNICQQIVNDATVLNFTNNASSQTISRTMYGLNYTFEVTWLPARNAHQIIITYPASVTQDSFNAVSVSRTSWSTSAVRSIVNGSPILQSSDKRWIYLVNRPTGLNANYSLKYATPNEDPMQSYAVINTKYGPTNLKALWSTLGE